MRIIDVQGEIRRPNTAPRLTIARIITKLCNQTLGRKNQADPTATEIRSVTIAGSQKMSIINIPQENKKANRILKSNRKAETRTSDRTIPSTITTAEK